MSGLEIIKLITTFQGYLMMACCLLSFWGFSKLNQTEKYISYYLFFLLITNSVMSMLSQQRVNNLAFTHMVVLGEFIFLSFFFREILGENTLYKKHFRPYLLLIGGLILANTLFLEKINTFNTNAKIMVVFLMISLSTAFFYDRSRRLMELDTHEKAVRLINAALLLYYAGSFFVYLFYKFTVNNEAFYSNGMLIFNAALYFVFTLLMLIAISLSVFQKEKSPA